MELAGIVNVASSLILKNILYTPNLTSNLISAHKLAKDENCLISYRANSYLIQDLTSKKLIGAANEKDRVYYPKRSAGGTIFTTVQSRKSILWHQ